MLCDVFSLVEIYERFVERRNFCPQEKNYLRTESHVLSECQICIRIHGVTSQRTHLRRRQCESALWGEWFARTSSNISDYTELFKMIVRVLKTCHTQYTWDRSICIFLLNRTTLHVFMTYLTGALYVHPLWFYKRQHENRVRSKLPVACQRSAVHRLLVNCAQSGGNA